MIITTKRSLKDEVVCERCARPTGQEEQELRPEDERICRECRTELTTLWVGRFVRRNNA